MTEFEQKVWGIWGTFVVRNQRLTASQALNEANRMHNGGVDVNPEVTATNRRDTYFSMSRKGAMFSLTRREKAILLLSLENAINHATFEVTP